MTILPKNTLVWVGIYLLALALFSMFSFGLTTPNLLLVNSSWFVNFQFLMWETFFHDRELTTMIFVVFAILFFAIYAKIWCSLPKKEEISTKQQVLVILLLSLPLLFSYNLLSADVFNYIFNSRMVIRYQADPHLRVAQEFPFDDWTRFMHNTHTAAPYGYGWTALSLLPYLAGAGKFLTTWLSFRLFSILSITLTSLSISALYFQHFKTKITWRAWGLLFFNPLLLVEVVANFHNDLWMIFPAMLAVLWVCKGGWWILVSLLAIAASISTKLASMALLPVIGGLAVSEIVPSVKKSKLYQFLIGWWPEAAASLMFLPLFTSRSQQFHPWYLLWSLAWLPLIKSRLIKTLLLVFSATSLLRYIPWLLENNYSPEILLQQRVITWSAMIITPVILFVQKLLLRPSSNEQKN